ncbi:MAG TPA: HAMP domain-containing sensor histidine kinase [Pseudoneobacillus sp.]|nr:HAMP domain-containing sensor histidine kinase [Pseudoneobacillus sp.]
MDIKWKNRGILLSIIVLFTLGASGVLSILALGSTYFKTSYFKTGEFESQLSSFIDYLNSYELNVVTKEEMLKNMTVSEEELERYRGRFGDISLQISEIQLEYDNRIQEARANHLDSESILIEERDKKIEDLKKILLDDEYVKEKILKEKKRTIEDYFSNLESNRGQFRLYQSAFSYYLKDSETGKVFTNLEEPTKEGVDKNDHAVFLRNYPSPNHEAIKSENQQIYNEENDIIAAMIKEQDGKVYEGQIAVLPSSQNAYILKEAKQYRERQILYFINSIFSILALALCVYLYKHKKVVLVDFYEKWRPVYQKVPMDIRLLITMITVFFTMIFIVDNGSSNMYLDVWSEINRIFSFIVLTPIVGFLFFQGKQLYDSLKNRQTLIDEWQNSLTGRIFQNVKGAFMNWHVGAQVVAILLIVFMFGAAAMLSLVENKFFVLFFIGMIVVGIPLGWMMIKEIGYFNRILLFASKLETGDFEKDLPIKGKSVLVKLAENLNEVKQKLKLSQNEQAKSERLKAELITNISHDLRTPLTSIITYAELLKNKNLEEEERESYLQIIDRKSKRLKVLIDDLFEVSKMTSGNIELKREKIDICQLVDQALAEYNETIEQSTLEFRVLKPESPVYVTVDGQKLWRVFDNLIGNIFKYSLNHTRVYINVETIGEKVSLTFKNISKYELGGNTDEMLERFKRGDTSRHTEGSGLGLAIAKSIIDLHEGSLDIEVDGDLFKVTVLL